MRTRTIALLSLVLISLVMVPQFDAAPSGIGSAAVSYTHLTLPTNREV